MTPDDIILLNGTSSSGKTTLAIALQGLLDQPYFHVSFDQFQQTFPPGFLVLGDGVNPATADGWLAVFRVAEQREQARGNRARGGARTFHDRVHAHGLYDLEVDTSRASPEECAQVIKEAIQHSHPRTAFRQLAHALA